MPLQSTSGAASYDAFGGGVAAVPKYIEEYFSTFLYSGNNTSQTITNGIDLSTKGGLVWIKDRVDGAAWHILTDTARGAGKHLSSNSTFAETAQAGQVSAFTTSGFSVGNEPDVNQSGETYVSWSWAKAPKFFDVVTWSGDGTSPRAISHNLGSAPGCVIIKQTNAVNDWCVWHTATGNDKSAALNLTDAFATFAQRIKSVTSTTFSVGNSSTVNDSGATYVAYLFAHDAGGFGLTGTDNVISCGSFTTTSGYSPNVELGYEPQWIMLKRTDSTGNWLIVDTMRGWVNPSGTAADDANLRPNLSDAEATNDIGWPYATGFNAGYRGGAESTWIYIAIRRGPMKVPTSGTSVFSPTLVTGNGTNDRQITGVGFPPDLLIGKTMGTTLQPLWYDKLRGKGKWLESSNTLAEQTLGGGSEGLMLQDGFVVDNNWGSLNINTRTYVDWMFRRAPSFFDEVCYTGTGVATNFTHNLGVAPELLIVKARNGNANWGVYAAPLGATKYLTLESNDPSGTSSVFWNNTAPTSTVFTLGTASGINGATTQGVAYLFSTCTGVSKVGSYTGTATTKQIDCGFTGGARFVLIKKTSGTGSWYVWDSARGIVSGNDPYLLLNSTAAEVTNTDYIDTYSAGFEISSTAPSEINENGGSFIFLAIA